MLAAPLHTLPQGPACSFMLRVAQLIKGWVTSYHDLRRIAARVDQKLSYRVVEDTNAIGIVWRTYPFDFIEAEQVH